MQAEPFVAPWSGGSSRPLHRVPAKACDTHHHIYDARFPTVPGAPLVHPDATIEDYRLLRRRLGTVRSVIVQPTAYGTDNRLVLESLARLEDSRGVVVLEDDIGEAELARMHEAGVRGARFNLMLDPCADARAAIRRRAAQIAAFGMHLQFCLTPDQLVELGDVLGALRVPVVIDHMALLPARAWRSHAGFAVLEALLQDGDAWVKLSGVYVHVEADDTSAYDRTLATELARRHPRRTLWGSDWPHPSKQAAHKPDDAALLDWLFECCEHEAAAHTILVDNPATLYGWP